MFGVVPAVAVGAALLVAASSCRAVGGRPPPRPADAPRRRWPSSPWPSSPLPTRVHERYGFPFFALGAILFAVSPRWRIAYVVLAIATFANMYVVLTTLYPPDDPALNPVRDWLGIGELLRSAARP